MRRSRPLPRLDLTRDLWASSSSSSSSNNDDDPDTSHPQSTSISSTTRSFQPPLPQLPPPRASSTNVMHHRRSLLPAYPSFELSDANHQEDHLLRPHLARRLLTNEQRQQRQRNTFPPPFILADQRRIYNNNNSRIGSFFLDKYQQFYGDLSRRLNVDMAILDYNYERMLRCIDLMTQERMRYRFQSPNMEVAEQLPIDEYPMALEFYLQIDAHLFYMKTCSFRGARLFSPNLFSTHEPDALYGLLRCNKSYCRFCFPTRSMNVRAQYHAQPVLAFSPEHRHQFVNGYQAILNCPVTCQTKNIIYALTCPCKQFDYIGYTSMSVGERLSYHRAHGNRIIHEFILGGENISRVQTKPKSQETLVKDGMLLYKHSTRCPYAIQMFLDCNPHYWPFIPMSAHQAQEENQYYNLPDTVPQDPTSHVVTSSRTRSDHDTGCCMVALPSLPSDQYTFSTRQCVEQFQFFKNKQDLRPPNFNLDLYDATIIAALPDRCSTTLKRLVEALFITHTETKLNTLGHLDGNISLNNNNDMDRSSAWCHNLVRRPV